MIKKIRALLFSLAGAITLLLPAIAMPVLVHADSIQPGLGCGANLQFTDSPTTDCSGGNGDPQGTVNNIVKTVINIFSVVVGIIAVIFIIIGGIKYITSGGDSNNVSSAKNTILYAIVGLVIVALAQILVRYVLAKVSQSTQ